MSDIRSTARELVAEALRCDVCQDLQRAGRHGAAAVHVLDALAPVWEALEATGELLNWAGEECSYDHHGYCQEHGLHPHPCPVQSIVEALAKLTEEASHE